MRYAQKTAVSVESTRADIESTLRRYGASAFAYGWSDDNKSAMVEFVAKERRIRFIIKLPDRSDRKFMFNKRGTKVSESARDKNWDQACRSMWRSLLLVIRAKLEAVAAGISVFEDEFLANVVLPNNETVGRWIRPQLKIAYETGRVPKMLTYETTANEPGQQAS